MDFLPHDIAALLDQFARAGGGGSSSGGSSGGSGDGGGIEFVFGYAPMHFVGAILARAVKKAPTLAIPIQVIGWIIAVVYAIFWINFWPIIGWLVAIAALAGMPAGLYGWFGKLKQSKLVQSRLKIAAMNDPAWDEQKLTDFAKQVFIRYQQDWTNQDTNAMQTYMTPRYHHHAALLIYNLKLLGRINYVQDVTIDHAAIVEANDDTDNSKDNFTIGFTARAKDSIVELATSQELFKDNNAFTEYWHFVRSDSVWLLDGISQATANRMFAKTDIEAFADQNGYYYSQDMGWLFIPKRGQLFGGAQFGKSDINNHVVGLYNNQLLVQLYSYIKDPQNNTKPMVIAQVNVPKQYGNIIVRRNKLIQAPIMFGNLKRVETEWTKFNKKYEVFATAPEQATSFELLNPTFMEQLEALPFEVNIEVVDNVIYLYTNERGSTVETYQTMYDLVNKAFKEMRL